MSKAEDLANEIYSGYTHITKLRRKDYCDGYHQAEKDLELNWKDILLLADIEQDVFNHSDSPLKGVQAAYEEVLRRFKERRG